jgi:ankyrin repeat protein
MIRFKLLTLTLSLATIFSGCVNKNSNSETKEDHAVQQEATVSDQQQESTAPGTGVLKQEAAINPEIVMQAALNGEVKSIMKAIEDGYDVNATDLEKHTALMMAAYNGHSEIVGILLDHGASPDAHDNQDRTALMYASTGPFNESVQLLLEAGADPNLVDNDEHFTAIMFAAAEGQKEVVSTLLKYGADKTLLDVDGESAYDFAVANGHPEVAALLK